MRSFVRLTLWRAGLAAATAIALVSLPILVWQLGGRVSPLFFAGYIGAAATTGVVVYLVRPRDDRVPARRLTLLLLGTSLFGFAALRDPQRMLFQIEGLWFDLLAGVFQAAVLHYLIAKIAGPLIFGRVWCGWACWTAALLDRLPYKRSGGRLHGHWGLLRYTHLTLSMLLVALLYYGFDYRPGQNGAIALTWFVIGNLLYYLAGIGLAFAVKDNRAFCKYVCPVAVPLKLGARFALLKVAGDAAKCDQDRRCIKTCPMDIRVSDYIKAGQRVLATECILCQQCINVCPNNALKLSFGLDIAGKELLVERPS
jgi:polyferredoxin